MSIISKANDSVDLVKNALDAKIALATAEQKELLADAKLALADLKELIADLKEENRSLRDKIKEKDDFHLDKAVYWKKSDTEQNQPFCPACYAKGKVIPLQKSRDGRDKTQSPWRCPDCTQHYNPWDYKEPPHIPRRQVWQ